MKAEIGNLTIDKDEDGDVLLTRIHRPHAPNVRLYLNQNEILVVVRWLVQTGQVKIEQHEVKLP